MPARVEPLVDQVGAKGLERDTIRGERRDVGELLERGASPQRERLAQDASRGGRLVADLPGARGRGSYPLGVESLGIEVEPVAGAVAFERVRVVAEVAAQARHVAVERAPSGVGRRLGPDGIEEGVDGDRAAGGHDEHREHGAPAGPGHVDRRALDRQPERAEHVDPHALTRSFVSCHRRATPVQPIRVRIIASPDDLRSSNDPDRCPPHNSTPSRS